MQTRKSEQPIVLRIPRKDRADAEPVEVEIIHNDGTLFAIAGAKGPTDRYVLADPINCRLIIGPDASDEQIGEGVWRMIAWHRGDHDVFDCPVVKGGAA